MRLRIAIRYILGLAIVLSPAVATAQETTRLLVPAEGTMLDLAVEGKATRRPDLVVINTGVVTQAATAAEAIAQNAERAKRLVAALKSSGLEDRDIQSASISLSPQYRHAENSPPTIIGYQASNMLTVKFRDIERAGLILDSLVRAGANQIDGPNFMLAQPDAALDEARTDALAKARVRAELYARALGMRVERILSISEAGPVPGPIPLVAGRANYMADMEAARTGVIPGEQDLLTTVTVRFLLK
ncbi:SIMPL domain-containing protein [Chelativorans sp.]|uniref:SIMPL domain-containing protein n=1 Tax=Chelativorans sp. TaxID=2203393 RepID=UPI002811AECC|nr:SIMPL domain-containing protein [Chelativorans sp.]